MQRSEIERQFANLEKHVVDMESYIEKLEKDVENKDARIDELVQWRRKFIASLQ